MTQVNFFLPCAQVNADSETQGDEDFNTLVLDYLQNQHPTCSCNELMEQLIALQHGTTTTMADLEVALCYADTIMRADPSESGYVSEYVDPVACRIIGVKMMMDTMLLGMQSTDDTADDRW